MDRKENDSQESSMFFQKEGKKNEEREKEEVREE